MTSTPHVLAGGGFFQNWSDINLITTDDDWSGVPSIIGFLGDIDAGAPTGVDPQTILAASTALATVDVNANEGNPFSFTTGGVAEFEPTGVADPVVALNGSGTADAPFLLIFLDTTGTSNINVAYNLRDLDASGDNAISQVALQYRVGDTGDFINLPDGFVADASQPNSAMLVTPVSVELPDEAENQPLVQVRIIMANAAGSDEWIGIDDITITAQGTSVPETTLDLSIAPTSFSETAGASAAIGTLFRTGSTAADLVVTLTSNDTSEATVPATVTIPAGQASTTFSVTAVDDAIVDGSQSVTITATADTLTDTFPITVTDNDVVLTPIFDIQGPGHVSPLAGQTVTTTGIVTAVDTNGFYLQDPTGDGNLATSDGIFVFTSSVPTAAVIVGNSLQVTGAVSEFFPGGVGSGNLSTTQLSGTLTITALSSGNPPPAATILGASGRVLPTETIISLNELPANLQANPGTFNPETDGIDFFESIEGMLVTVEDAVVVSPREDFGGGSPFEFFVLANQGAGVTGRNSRGGITINDLDPASDTTDLTDIDFNPERIQIDALVDDNLLPAVNPGALVGNITGVVSYSFGNFEVLVSDPVIQTTPSPLTPEITSLVAESNSLSIATYNVLNLDPNDSDGDTDVAAGRFDLIAEQIINNLGTPDVIALQEVQDSDGSVNSTVTSAEDTLQALVAAIAQAGGPSYEFIDNTFIEDDQSGGQPGANIRTAYLYNPERVGLVDGSVQTVLDTTALPQSNPANPFFDSRLPLVATFTFNGEEITVINNHFTSRGGSNPLFGGIQPPVIGGDDERLAQAQANRDFVNTLLTANSDANVVVLGDLNGFQFETYQTQVLGGTGSEPPLTNLTNTLDPLEAVTFVFDGNGQALDHIFVSDSLLAAGAEYDIVDVNANFVDSSQRASDHNPAIARFTLGAPDFNIVGTDGDDTLSGTDGADTIDGLGGNDTLNGLGGNDTLIGGEGDDTLLPGTGNDTVDGGPGNDTADFSDIAASGVLADLTTGEALSLTLLPSAEDFSGDRLNPTTFDLALGANRISNRVSDAQDFPQNPPPQDIDFVTVIVPAGAVLSAVVLSSFASGDNAGFVALQAGSTFTLAREEFDGAGDPDVLSLLGLGLVGDSATPALVGTDVLDDLLLGGNGVFPDLNPGFIPTSAPLGAGTYTFWIQQQGPSVLDYSFDFIVEAADGELAPLNVAEADESVNASLENIENLTGTPNDDGLEGNGAANILEGGAGNDILIPGNGADTVDGGEGSDTANFSTVSFPVTVDLGAGTATYTNGAGVLVTDTLTSIENAAGTVGDDTLTGDGGNNVLDGGEGNDTLNGGGGADTLLGREGSDTLLPGGGNDIVDGGDGVGVDTVDFSTVPFPVTANLTTGIATYTNGAGTLITDTLINLENVSGTAGNDSITGDAANNLLSGGEGDDTFSSGGGNDTINGGAGTDTISIAGTLADVDIAIAGNVATVTIGGNTLTITDGEFLAFNDGTDFEITIPQVTLVGFAVLPADTFAEGPPAGGNSGNGQPISANGRTGPFPGQPVQGFSGVQFADPDGSFYFLSDNGFGGQANSTDFLLRIYQLDPDFAGAEAGDASVELEGFIQLADPNNLIPFAIINEGSEERLLTGGDFDVESFVIAANGDIWVGDEFGPFILHFNSEGTLLEAPIATPNVFPVEPGNLVRSPQNPEVLAGEAATNLGGSRGFEGLAFSPDRNTLYPLLEGTVAGDPANSLRIYEFDLPSSSFTGLVGFYELEFAANAIGDFTPINDNEFLVIERDNLQGAPAEFKRIYKVDFSVIDANGFVEKELVADLLSIQDPSDLNGDGSTSFDFPFQTIEDVLVIDANTIIVANDNNFPFSIGRGPDIDNNEIILLELEQPLNLDPRLGQEAVSDLTNEPVFGTPGDDVLEGSIDFDAIRDLLFVGGGADLVDASPVTGTIGTGPRNRVYGGTGTDELLAGIADRLFGGEGADELNSVNGTGGNRLFGGDGDDEITVGSGDRAFGGLGNDILDATLSAGGSRLYGGAGDDLFFLGAGDRVVGGEGNDLFFVGEGSDNLITGGTGADEFAIANAQLPTDVNTITDFEAGVDTISINGLGLSIADVVLESQNGDTLVSTQAGDGLAVLLGVNASSLSAANFVFR